MDTSSQIFINLPDSNQPLSQKDINHEEINETSPQIFLSPVSPNQSQPLSRKKKQITKKPMTRINSQIFFSPNKLYTFSQDLSLEETGENLLTSSQKPQNNNTKIPIFVKDVTQTKLNLLKSIITENHCFISKPFKTIDNYR